MTFLIYKLHFLLKEGKKESAIDKRHAALECSHQLDHSFPIMGLSKLQHRTNVDFSCWETAPNFYGHDISPSF